jgi:hypothetical protein
VYEYPKTDFIWNCSAINSSWNFSYILSLNYLSLYVLLKYKCHCKYFSDSQLIILLQCSHKLCTKFPLKTAFALKNFQLFTSHRIFSFSKINTLSCSLQNLLYLFHCLELRRYSLIIYWVSLLVKQRNLRKNDCPRVSNKWHIFLQYLKWDQISLEYYTQTIKFCFLSFW